MSDLTTWLRAQLDVDEQVARAASPGPWSPNAESDEVLAIDGERVADGFALSGRQLRATVEHIALHDPARVLAELDAKRRILAEHLKAEYRDECRRCFDPDTAAGDYDFETFPCPTLRAVALPYADRPGYRQEWAPASAPA